MSLLQYLQKTMVLERNQVGKTISQLQILIENNGNLKEIKHEKFSLLQYLQKTMVLLKKSSWENNYFAAVRAALAELYTIAKFKYYNFIVALTHCTYCRYILGV